MTWDQQVEQDMINETSAEARLAEIQQILGCREGHEPGAVRALMELVPPQVPVPAREEPRKAMRRIWHGHMHGGADDQR